MLATFTGEYEPQQGASHNFQSLVETQQQQMRAGFGASLKQSIHVHGRFASSYSEAGSGLALFGLRLSLVDLQAQIQHLPLWVGQFVLVYWSCVRGVVAFARQKVPHSRDWDSISLNTLEMRLSRKSLGNTS